MSQRHLRLIRRVSSHVSLYGSSQRIGEKELFKSLAGVKPSEVPESVLRQLGWSEARVKAFRHRDTNPNQYYYRFNDPGIPQATGKWSSKDKALFLKVITEYGVDYRVNQLAGHEGQWGIFSTHIPGRVGYQCSNYYRQLVKEGKIQDDNYVMNEDGKLVFRFRNSAGKSTLDRHKRGASSPGKSGKRAHTEATSPDGNSEELEKSVLPVSF